MSNEQSGTRSKTRRASNFNDLPFIWRANLHGVNECTTTEGVDPVFPNAGKEVVYGGGLGSTSPVTLGTCDSPIPHGATYMDLGGKEPGSKKGSTYSAASVSSGARASAEASSSLASSTAQDYASADLALASSPSTTARLHSQSARSTLLTSYHKTSYHPSSHHTTSHQTSSHHTSSHHTSTHSTSSHHTPSYYTSSDAFRLAGITWSNNTASTSCTSTKTLYYSLANTTHVSATPSPTPNYTPIPTPTATQPSSPVTATPLPYGSDTSVAFTPCSPGTYLCMSSTDFAQCIGGSTYQNMGSVAAGMMCLPYSAANTADTLSNVSAGGGPAGTHREDKYVRAQPLGGCGSVADGSMECLRGGTGFAVCDQGGWVDMGAVAQGTVCRGSPGSAVIVAV